MRTIKEYDERRNEILHHASQLFISKGYERTTINDILKAVNIAKGTFYYYFKSKEEVMDAVIMQVIESDIATAQEIINQVNLSPIDKIINILLSQSNNNTFKEEIIDQFDNTENIFMKQKALERTIEHMCPILEQIIIEGNKNNDFDTLYPLESIQFIVAGIQILSDNKDSIASKQQVDSFINIIFRVLGINETKIHRDEVKEKIEQIFKS